MLNPIRCYLFPWECVQNEHSLWNFPRDIIKAFVNSSFNVFKKVEHNLGLSNITKGLDTDKLFENCSDINDFKNRLKLIFPGSYLAHY